MAHVLVADDDDDIRELIVMTVASMGHSCHEVTDGTAALDALSTLEFDLALLDISMPGATGLEVVSQVRSVDPTHELPTVLISALSTDADIERGMTVGADLYLTKPLSLRELVESTGVVYDGPVLSVAS